MNRSKGQQLNDKNGKEKRHNKNKSLTLYNGKGKKGGDVDFALLISGRDKNSVVPVTRYLLLLLFSAVT
jgi:hypothetical protein